MKEYMLRKDIVLLPDKEGTYLIDLFGGHRMHINMPFNDKIFSEKICMPVEKSKLKIVVKILIDRKYFICYSDNDMIEKITKEILS